MARDQFEIVNNSAAANCDRSHIGSDLSDKLDYRANVRALLTYSRIPLAEANARENGRPTQIFPDFPVRSSRIRRPEADDPKPAGPPWFATHANCAGEHGPCSRSDRGPASAK